MKFTVLGSGSGGNCAVVSHAETHVLIDAGLSAGQIQARLEAVGLELGQLTAILLTHEHGDHVRGLEVLTKRHKIPIFANAMTRQVVSEVLSGDKSWRVIQPGQVFSIGAVEVDCFSVPHDAVDPMGFVLRAGEAHLGILSDVGHVTQLIRSKLREVHSLFIEANYDGQRLAEDTKRPWSTKQRIMSQHGHLSNQQMAECLAECAHPFLERVVLGHLSRDCNHPDLAKAAAAQAVAPLGFEMEILCAEQEKPTAWLPVRTRPLPALPQSAGARIPSVAPLIQGELF